MSKPKYVEFPVGINKKYLDDACYELDRKTDTLTISSEGNVYNFPKERAQTLVNRFSIKKIITLRKLASYLSLLLFFLLLLTIPLRSDSWFLSTILLLTIMILLFIDLYLAEIENYYNISKCKKCGRDFAYEEIKKPLYKKVSSYNDYEETETRYLKCKYCNNEDLKIKSLLKSSKSKKRRGPKKGKICKICNKSTLIEYRYPDTHLESMNLERTIKHYKCTSCGYMEISIKDKIVDTD